MANKVTTTFNRDTSTIEFRGKCGVTGEVYAVNVPYDQYKAWRSGELVQRAMPQLTPDQREFLISKTTPAEWKEMWKSQEAEASAEL